MEEKEIKLRLASAWLDRALGKDSHSGFESCVAEAQNYLRQVGEQELADKLSYANLHFQKPVVDVRNILKEKYGIREYGDMPNIERLEGELRYGE